MPNIVRTMQLGNTTVHICSDCFPKSEEERKQVEQNIIDTMWAWWESHTVEEQIALNASLEEDQEKSAG
jgi:hypothetical protein